MQNIISAPRTRQNIKNVPEDAIKHMAGFLSPKDTGRLSQTTRLFYEATQDNTVWRHKLTTEAQGMVESEDSQSALKLFKYFDGNRLVPYRSMDYFIKNTDTKRLSSSIVKYIKNEKISLDKALNLTWMEGILLNQPVIQKYIDNGLLPFEDALNLTPFQLQNLEVPGVQEYIDNGKLTLQEVLNSFPQELSSILKKRG